MRKRLDVLLAERGLADFMAHFPQEIIWTNGWPQELARMGAVRATKFFKVKK